MLAQHSTPLHGWLRFGAWCATVVLIGTIVLSLNTRQIVRAASTTYYLDCSAGSDSRSGTSEQDAWQSLSKASKSTLLPGDRLLLKRGCAWTGPLTIAESGTQAQPIIISAYGDGELPTIQNSPDGNQVIIGGDYLVLEYLYARVDAQQRDAGCQNQPVGYTIGFRFEDSADNITLRYSRASGLTHGAKVRYGSDFNQIVYNVFSNNSMMFLLDAGGDNDSGANGLVVEGSDNEIAFNDFIGHDACSYDHGRDGSAIELYGGRRNKIHHNRALNNNTFTELGKWISSDGASEQTSADNIYAYNLVVATVEGAQFLVTRGGGSRGKVSNTRAYNNTVYLKHPTSFAVNCDQVCGSDVLKLRNNIIWSEGLVGYIDTTGADEGYNIFWKSDGLPVVNFPRPQDLDGTSRIINPRFADVDTYNLHLAANSPAINTGTNDAVLAGFAADLDQVAAPQSAGVDIGVYEFPTAHFFYLPTIQ